VPGALLVAFFVSSTLLSRFRARNKQAMSQVFQKGARRDLGQVLANGGWGAVLAVISYFGVPGGAEERVRVLSLVAYVGAIAAVTADTWATEIGVLSKVPPRMITSGRPVPAGTSGGVTLLGTLVSLAGGLFIGVTLVSAAGIAELVRLTNVQVLSPFGIGAGLWLFFAGIAGLGGALFDSLLGANVQGIYFSDYDERQTEKKTDSQGNPTRLLRGWAWMDNDLVNFVSSIFGSGVALLLFSSL
jgi:uncharacterized protein (TIGR00297 family)